MAMNFRVNQAVFCQKKASVIKCWRCA